MYTLIYNGTIICIIADLDLHVFFFVYLEYNKNIALQ